MLLTRKWLAPPTLTMLMVGTTSLAGPFSHQRNQLPGPRATAMGGAFVAVADDPSAVYWNPAGYSLIDRPEVSVSGIGLIQSSTTYDETVSDKPFVEHAQSLSPGFFGASIRNGRLGAGYGFAALDERNVNQNDSFRDVPLVTGEVVDYYRTYQESSTLSAAGAGLSWLLGGGLSLGISGAYYRRQSAVSNYQNVSGPGDSFTTRNLKYETLNEGLLGTGGLLMVAGNFRAGFSYRYPFPIANNTTVSNSVADSPGSSGLPGSQNQLSSVEGKSDDMDEPRIRTYQLGLAWGVPGTGIVAVDLVKHAPGKAEEGRGLQTTYNYSAGFEAGVGGLVFRGGMFSNTSLYPDPARGKANQPTAIDYHGLSWGVGITQKFREVSVTYVRQTGSGTAQMVADSYETQQVQGTLESLLLSSRVFF
ncbi:hypothetical protein EBZ80_05745 [bacterium]|nr:hypothetical protein [bacterium]